MTDKYELLDGDKEFILEYNPDAKFIGDSRLIWGSEKTLELVVAMAKERGFIIANSPN